ncbi:MAG: hypothetical protein ACJAYC_000312 [Halieaceae bacterium]|jgi:uncharacterized protein YeeX (DUF496 family)
MDMRQRQAGMSIPSILIIVIMVGFFVMCAIRMTPVYLEYLTVKRVMTQIAEEYKPEENSIRDIRRKVSTMLNTNQVYLLQPREVEVFRKNGKIMIDSNYEARVPVMGIIDAVMTFDDLVFVAGVKVTD